MHDAEASSGDDSDGAGRRQTSGSPASMSTSMDADKLALLVADIRGQVHAGTCLIRMWTPDAQTHRCAQVGWGLIRLLSLRAF